MAFLGRQALAFLEAEAGMTANTCKQSSTGVSLFYFQ